MVKNFKNKYKGQTALIIGNGPSLQENIEPLAALMLKYPSFAANKFYGTGLVPTFWTCVDYDMCHDCVPWVQENWMQEPPVKFVNMAFPLIGSHALDTRITNHFSTDASVYVTIGGTVTYVNMQLAYYMGFEKLLLFGLDHKYPKTYSDGIPGSKFIAEGEDPDHFKMLDGSPYFTPGRLYNRPELYAIEKFTYPQAKKWFKDIVNLTPGTALKTFRKGEWGKYA